MSSTTTVYVSSVPMYQTRTPFQHARPARETRKVRHVIRTTPDGSSTRETRSLELDRKQRLPIGVQPSGSGSRGATPSPPRSSVEKSRSRALRRQGSIFNVPITSNPAASESSTSLSSTDSQESTYSAGSLPETRGFSSTRQRKANLPAPLVLNVTSNTDSDHDRHTSTSSASPTSTPRPSQFAQKLSQNTSLASTSMPESITVPKSSAGYPTPLTPSFRFVAAANPAHRVRRLQKLARTLGDNIPHSLVFPTYPSSDGSAPATPVSERPDTKFDTAANPNPVSMAAARRVSMTNTRENGYRRASGGSLRSLNTNASPSISSLKRDPKGPSRWQPPVEWTLEPLHTPRRESVDDEEFAEVWDTESYDAILHRLRNLKR